MDAPIFKNIYAVNTDGCAEEKLTEDNHSFAPALSPDGSKIAFIHIKAETCENCFLSAQYELYVMDADGPDPHFVAALDQPFPFISWSPDSKGISYGGWPERQSQSPALSGSRLYLAALDSSESPRLVSQNVIGPPKWSPDGKWIVHGCTADRLQPRPEVSFCLTELGKEGKTSVLTDGANLSRASWSPDGTRIAFVVWERNTRSVFVARTDGSPPKAMTSTNWIFTKPQWSPDGQKILFEDVEKRKAAIFVMNADGSTRQRLTDPKLGASNPVWSPDGKQIAFAAVAHGWLQVHLMNSDGSGLRQISHDNKMGYSVRAWLPSSSLLLLSCGYLKSAYLEAPMDVRLCLLDVNDPQGRPRQLAKNFHSTYSFAPIPPGYKACDLFNSLSAVFLDSQSRVRSRNGLSRTMVRLLPHPWDTTEE